MKKCHAIALAAVLFTSTSALAQDWGRYATQPVPPPTVPLNPPLQQPGGPFAPPQVFVGLPAWITTTTTNVKNGITTQTPRARYDFLLREPPVVIPRKQPTTDHMLRQPPGGVGVLPALPSKP